MRPGSGCGHMGGAQQRKTHPGPSGEGGRGASGSADAPAGRRRRLRPCGAGLRILADGDHRPDRPAGAACPGSPARSASAPEIGTGARAAGRAHHRFRNPRPRRGPHGRRTQSLPHGLPRGDPHRGMFAGCSGPDSGTGAKVAQTTPAQPVPGCRNRARAGGGVDRAAPRCSDLRKTARGGQMGRRSWPGTPCRRAGGACPRR